MKVLRGAALGAVQNLHAAQSETADFLTTGSIAHNNMRVRLLSQNGMRVTRSRIAPAIDRYLFKAADA
jgi:hypothetical protein